jgi:hypothetical protein
MELLTADQQEFDACKVDAARWTRVTTAIDFLEAGYDHTACSGPAPEEQFPATLSGLMHPISQLELHYDNSRYQREAPSHIGPYNCILLTKTA